MKALFFLSFMFVCWSNTGWAQWEEISLENFAQMILDVEAKMDKNTSYAYDVDYLFFDFADSKDTVLKYDGSLAFSAKHALMNLYQFDRFIIQDAEVQLTCDTAYKQIVINHPNPDFLKRKEMEDFKKLINSQCKAHKSTKGKNTIYTITFAPTSPYKGAELWMDKSGIISKYVLYSAQEVLDDSNETPKTIQPRMEVLLSAFESDLGSIDKKITPVSKYIDLDSMELTEFYKDFELIDLRN